MRVVADVDVEAEVARARLHRQDVGQQLQQCGLAGPVRPDEHDALAALGDEVHAPVDLRRAVGVINVFERDDAQSAARRLWETKLDAATFLDRRFALVHALDLFEFGLRL